MGIMSVLIPNGNKTSTLNPQMTSSKVTNKIFAPKNIREVFELATTAEVFKALKIYSNSIYGSCLFDLGGEKAKQMFNPRTKQ